MRAFTNPWRSLAYLYSAFSDKSPWARATAISLGRSMLSSRSRAVISSWSLSLIFFSGSDMVDCLSVSILRVGDNTRVTPPRKPQLYEDRIWGYKEHRNVAEC